MLLLALGFSALIVAGVALTRSSSPLPRRSGRALLALKMTAACLVLIYALWLYSSLLASD